jgi:hypothetical protein
MVANPSYWGGAVPVPKVYFPVYSTNAAAQNALFAGQIDWTGNYIPELQKDFIDKDPAHNYAYEGADASNALYPNLSKFPTNQLAVRKAIDVALDRTAIDTQGESGLEAPVLNASGITQPAFSAWLAGERQPPGGRRPVPGRLHPDGGRLQEGQRGRLRAERQGSRRLDHHAGCLQRLRERRRTRRGRAEQGRHQGHLRQHHPRRLRHGRG